MEGLKKYVVIDQFEDGWDINEFIYDEVLFEYCTDALYIPEKNIEETSFKDSTLEILLSNLTPEDLGEDWFTNIKKLANDIGEA